MDIVTHHSPSFGEWRSVGVSECRWCHLWFFTLGSVGSNTAQRACLVCADRLHHGQLLVSVADGTLRHPPAIRWAKKACEYAMFCPVHDVCWQYGSIGNMKRSRIQSTPVRRRSWVECAVLTSARIAEPGGKDPVSPQKDANAL